MPMENPYLEYKDQVVGRVLSGERVEVTSQPGLSERLRMYAFYCTEQTGAENALLSMDLMEAVDVLRSADK